MELDSVVPLDYYTICLFLLTTLLSSNLSFPLHPFLIVRKYSVLNQKSPYITYI